MDASFPHPYVAVDVVALSWREDPDHPLGARLLLALLERTGEPPRGWALPGAYVQLDEEVNGALDRVYASKLGLDVPRRPLPLPPFGGVDRDSRRRTIALPVVAMHTANPPPLAADAVWGEVRLDELGQLIAVMADERAVELLFDHTAILQTALSEIQRRLAADDLDVLRALLPGGFALRELERIWNALKGTPHNTASFRRRMGGLTKPTGEPWLTLTDDKEENVGRRAARLYRWT